MIKKIISVLLCLILVFCTFGVVSANEYIINSGLTMSFYSMPPTYSWGNEYWFGIEFHAPEGLSYTVSGIGYLHGICVGETYRELVVKNGDRIEVCVPEGYNYADAHNYDFMYVITGVGDNAVMEQVYLSSAIEGAKKKIAPLCIPATVRYNTSGYLYASLSGYVTSIPAGTTVEYMNPDSSSSMRVARIKLSSGQVCWVPMSAINISTTNYTIPDNLVNAEREAFVNINGYGSKTNYLIWVNKQRQMLTVFEGSYGNWKVLRNFYVATGKNTTPTPTIVCEYTVRTSWITPSYSCKTVMYLYNGYALHNQPVSPSGYVKDKTIGAPASAGCVRMLLDDVNWMANTVPVGTTVVLY
ncbi:MAG: L,D-transpeptidase [Clostridia bacterium]|nr:L,D-transpeptidase [Clostridia bacterium]